MGEFKFEELYEIFKIVLIKERERRPPKKLTNGEIYLGEWIIGTNIREGRGKILCTDGKFLDGWFHDNLL